MAHPAFSFFGIALVLPFARLVLAANDWSTACLDGKCSYDLSGNVTGTLYITGNTSAISDLTEAAGWNILDCNSTSGAQDIRAVCTNSTAGCNNLFEGGAIGTIVRLPEDCGTMPFARVANIWDHENQTSSVLTRRSRFFRLLNTSSVKGITLDTNFSAVDPQQNGNVTFEFQGASIPSAEDSFQDSRRSLDIFSKFTKNVTEQVPPITIDKEETLFNQPVDCDTDVTIDGVSVTSCSLQVGMDVNANVSAFYGVSVSGSVVPPKLDDLTLFTVATPSVELFQVGIPGLDIPGILSIGPTFQVDAQGIVNVAADLNTAVGFTYNLNNTELFFPPAYGQSSTGDVSSGNAFLQLSTAPYTPANASLTAELVPSIAFGIDVLDGTAKATISLDLNTFATLELSGEGNVTASTTSGLAVGPFCGCFHVLAGVNITADADASLLDIFDKDDSITLFSKTFDLFNVRWQISQQFVVKPISGLTRFPQTCFK
ncbi:hypothetical protein IEO21_05653 [Rhodonia placenta]|uniref:DUF7223 domain-containing protein n=1 Tax=Rhodonia placenta TaxID=104341 RepID=A0A8H7P1G7_9APHY|nr:hypothetical protein IEO21_05653 [Postia placenta]